MMNSPPRVAPTAMPATAPLDNSVCCVSDDGDAADVVEEDVGLMTAVIVATEPLLSVFVAVKVLGESVEVNFLVAAVVVAVLAVRM